MKKFLLLAAATTMMVSCVETEKIGNDLFDNAAPRVIGFNTITEKATRANVEDLETYHTTFAVYSTKKSNNDQNAAPEIVFCGDSLSDIITYQQGASDPNNWTYAPYRYWDKQATYSFAAVAPNASIIRYDSVTNVAHAEGTYVSTDTINGYTLVGTNLQSNTNPGEAEIKSGFTGTNGKDTDIMTAAKITDVNGAAGNTVNLIFKHILAKLNISIAKDQTLNNYIVSIKKVEITGLDDKGVYHEGSSTNTSSWTASASANAADYKLIWENENGYQLPNGNNGDGAPRYFIESLIMPQAIGVNVEKLTIDYTIKSGNNSQNYNYELKFDDGEGNKIFENFMESNNYTIKLTIRPNVITFDASSEVWTDKDKSLYSDTQVNN